MLNKNSSRKTLQAVSQTAYFVALLGTFIAIVLAIVALTGLQSLHSELDQLQEGLLFAADEVAAQQAYMQRLAAWAAEFEGFCNDRKIQDAQLKAICEANPTLDTQTAPTVRTDLTTLLTAQYGPPWTAWGIILVTLFILLALVTSGLFRRAAARRELELLRAEHKRGYREGIKHTAKVLDRDTSVLRNVTVWLHHYRSSREDVATEGAKTRVAETAAGIFQQLLARLDAQLSLKPIGQIGDVVTFEPKHHRTRQADLNPGDQARIIEPGWKLDSETIRKPLVGR